MGSVWTEPFCAHLRFMRVSCRTWQEVGALEGIVCGGTVDKDAETPVSASASLTAAQPPDIGGDYVRIYLDADFAGGGRATECLGTFAATRPTLEASECGAMARLELYGVLSVLADAVPAGTVTVPAGGSPVEAARAAIARTGVPIRAEETPQRLSDCRVYGLSAVEGVDDDVLSIVNDLMGSCSFHPAMEDPYGAVILRRKRDDAARLPDWELSEGPLCRFLAEVTEELDVSEVRNCVKVVASCGSGVTVAAAMNQDPASPYSTVSLGREMWKVVRPGDPMEYEEALREAERELRESSAPKRSVTFQHVFFPLALRDVISFSYPSRGIGGRFRVASISYDLASPAVMMTVTAEEVAA